MNLKAIRDESRKQTGDTARPYFWSDEWFDARINEAETEACIRGRLIEDASSVASSIDITTTEKRYPLHESIIDVLDCVLESNPDIAFTDWTLNESELILGDYPATDDTLLMTVIRKPLSTMESDSDEPEIRSNHHLHLVDWVKHCAYLVQDADTFDPQAAERSLALFEAYFGARQTANVLRKHKAKHGRTVRMGSGW